MNLLLSSRSDSFGSVHSRLTVFSVESARLINLPVVICVVDDLPNLQSVEGLCPRLPYAWSVPTVSQLGSEPIHQYRYSPCGERHIGSIWHRFSLAHWP